MDNSPNTQRRRFYLSFCLSAIASFGVFAQTGVTDADNINNQLEAHLVSGDDDNAYSLGVTHRDSLEGDTRFDRLFGIAAQRTGHCNEALFSLERATQSNPYDLLTRLALAQCYMVMGNLTASQTELDYISEAPGNTKLNDAVAALQAQLTNQRYAQDGGWQGGLWIGAGVDSNPNNGVEDEFVSIPALGQIKLFDDSREQSSALFLAGGAVSYKRQLTQQLGWYLKASGEYEGFNQSDALPRGTIGVTAGIDYRWRDIETTINVFAQPVWLDGEGFLNYQGVSFEGAKPVSDASAMGLSLVAAEIDYDELDALSRDQYRASFWYGFNALGAEHRLQLLFADEQSQQSVANFNSRDVTGLLYRYSRTLDTHWAYTASAGYQQAKYDDVQPLFGEVRDDNLLNAEMSVTYTASSQLYWQLTASYLKNDSNLSLYSYTRSRLWLSANYRF